MRWETLTFDEHLNDLCKPRSWGTQVELQAYSDCVNVNIFICSHNPGDTVRWEKGNAKEYYSCSPEYIYCSQTWPP